MPRRLITAHQIASYAVLVFFISFGVLAWNINQAGIAAAYNDSIAHIRAQDEAPIVSATIRMTKDSDWMTPKLMGRPFILKPPLLIWLSALSIRMLGLSLFSVRLPVLLLGAAGVAAVFAWGAYARSMAAGVLGGCALTQPLLAELLAAVPDGRPCQFVCGNGACRRRF
jgi:4-amino-4-deoxy-L-arabinose transferase-like glycosyltransferase